MNHICPRRVKSFGQFRAESQKSCLPSSDPVDRAEGGYTANLVPCFKGLLASRAALKMRAPKWLDYVWITIALYFVKGKHLFPVPSFCSEMHLRINVMRCLPIARQL